MSLRQNLWEVIPQWQRVRHVICKVTTINIVVSCISLTLKSLVSKILPPRSWIMLTSATILSNKPSSTYGDLLGGAYTIAKNNGAAPECWNYSHNLVPCVLCFHRDTQFDHESFTNIATPPLCFTVAMTELMSNTGCGLCKHWKPGICNGISSGNKCVSISAITSESSNSLCICELVLSFVFVPPWMFHREIRNAFWSQHP